VVLVRFGFGIEESSVPHWTFFSGPWLFSEEEKGTDVMGQHSDRRCPAPFPLSSVRASRLVSFPFSLLSPWTIIHPSFRLRYRASFHIIPQQEHLFPRSGRIALREEKTVEDSRLPPQTLSELIHAPIPRTGCIGLLLPPARSSCAYWSL